MGERKTFLVTGTDTAEFLQGLITNDVKKIDSGMVYAAILTPQGKFLADFFLSRRGDAVVLDVDAGSADALVQRLSMYKLRADVRIEPAGLFVHRGTAEIPEDGFPDPRHPDMGWRAYRDTKQTGEETDWDAIRVAHCIPETGSELGPDSYILEAGFERLNGVDFRKGCYVGQEVTARMKHKTELRKGFVTVSVRGAADPGTPITSEGREVGTLFTRSGDRAIAFLRLDRTGPDMVAGEAGVSLD